MAQRLQGERDVTWTTHARQQMLRFSLGLFALAALTMLLVAGWLRFFVPAARQAPRVRDVSWLQQRER